jgi:glycosyltransferase involved in cell wall biosynthesis
MTKIGMILDAPFPPDYRVEKEAITLVQQGHEVFLFCLNYKGGGQVEMYKGFSLAHYPTDSLTYKFSALAYTVPIYRWIMQRKIRHFLKKFQPEIVHVHDMVVAEAAFRVARSLNKKIVLDLHENRPESMREYRHLSRFPGKIMIDLSAWEKKQLELVNRADKVIVVTSLAKEDLLKESTKGAADIIVLPNTSALDFSEQPLREDILQRMKNSFNLLYVGDTSLRRGTDDAIRATALLKTKIPNIRLWLIGTSSSDDYLKSLTQELSIKEIVHFEGWQPQHLFNSYMAGAHVCLSPLKKNRHHDTTFANKLFQYMSLQKAVVVSDCIAQAKVVSTEKCGLIYPAGNIEALCECIIELHHNPTLRDSFGKNARAAVEERWNWEKTSETLIQMYRELAMT